MLVQRVVVLGRGGAGKSVLARELGRLVNLPVVELDREFWGANLEPMPLDVWRKRQQTMAEEPRWIMDDDLGPYDDPAPRLRRADTVVVLAMPFWLCTWRAVRRGHEQRDFWRWALRWRRQSRPRLMAAIATHAPAADVVVFRGSRAAHRWLSVRS